MATALATEKSDKPLLKFTCLLCDVIPNQNQIYRCSKNHTLCILCGFKNGSKCMCGCQQLSITKNPLLTIAEGEKCCQYKNDGCQWKFSENDDISAHTSECKFRPYKCIGVLLGVWSCPWAGTQLSVADHFKSAHAKNDPFYNYWQHGSVHFDMNRTCSKINLVDAFNKKFVFYYMSFAKNPNVFFIIYLIGRKCDAQKYVIDFELKENGRKIKFVEECYSDADDLEGIIQTHRCIVITKQLVKTFVKDGEINFRFVLKRKDLAEEEDAHKEEYLRSHLLSKYNNNNAPSPTPISAKFKAPKTDAIKFNGNRNENGKRTNKRQ